MSDGLDGADLETRFDALEERIANVGEECPDYIRRPLEDQVTTLRLRYEELQSVRPHHTQVERLARSIAIKCRRLEAILERIPDGQNESNPIELVRELVEDMDSEGSTQVDAYFYPSPLEDYIGFETYIIQSNGRIGMVIEYGNQEGILDPPILALVAHEVAHLIPEAQEMSERRSPFGLQFAEVICDHGGLALMGPSFAEGFSRFATHIPSVIAPPDNKHPAWVTRAVLMTDIGCQQWTDEFRPAIEEHLSHLATRQSQLGSSQDDLLDDVESNEPTLVEVTRRLIVTAEDLGREGEIGGFRSNMLNRSLEVVESED